MESQRPAAIFENREYFYTVKSRTPNEIIIEMYSTLYILVRDKDGRWINHLNNRYQLAKGLLQAVVTALSA